MDDCWQVSRDAQGTIQADPQAFPSGIPALVDYVHSKKLKFGLYSGIGIDQFQFIISDGTIATVLLIRTDRPNPQVI
jgi:hypothetical protein